MESSPTIGIQSIKVRVTVCNDGIQRKLFLGFSRKDNLVDRGFSCDALSIVDRFTTVDEILQVLVIALKRCHVQSLEDTASELVLANLQGSLTEILVNGICTHIDHVPTRFEVSIVTRDMEGSELI